MFIFGHNFISGRKATPLTPVDHETSKYNNITIYNGLYDNCYLTNDVKTSLDGTFLHDWNWETILWAKFNGTTNAGNVDWNLKNISHLLIKRREKDEYVWKSLYYQDVKTADDVNINGYDYTNASGVDYVYALVPILEGMEGAYSISEVNSDFDGIFIVESDKIYGTRATDGACDYTRTFPNTTVPTLNNKYPVDVETSSACYDTGTVSGKFLQMNEECEYIWENDKERVKYEKWVVDQLSNRKPKLLKNLDGYIRLVKIEDQIQDNMETTYNNRKLQFSWTEIGDYNSEEHMYYSGLSNCDERWWNYTTDGG